MKEIRQTGLGVITALISICVVLGSFSLALSEGGVVQAMLQTATDTPFQIFQTLASTPQPPTAVPQTPTLLTSNSGSQSPQPSQPTETPTTSTTPSPTIIFQANCPPMPPGWMMITVEPGDTLASLADMYNTTVELLREVNCLVVDTLMPGSTLYVPALAQPTQPVVKCGPPPGWDLYYIVQPGDTLFHISQLYGITVNMLRFANCITGDYIRPGQRLYVPYALTLTFTPSATPKPSSTGTPAPSPTSTGTPIPPTSTPTLPVLPPTATVTRTQPPVWTATSTSTNPPPLTNTPTLTSVVSSTSTITPTPSQIASSTATWTATPTQTVSPPTATPSPTSTSTSTPTPTASSTLTLTPTTSFTPTETFTVQPTSTLTATPTATETKASP